MKVSKAFLKEKYVSIITQCLVVMVSKMVLKSSLTVAAFAVQHAILVDKLQMIPASLATT